ncbi:MAG: hypothetical protein FWC26_06620 [Fibromonadales bacterium]|nr:hypothetical protein [Fibromonadales bacterium]
MAKKSSMTKLEQAQAAAWKAIRKTQESIERMSKENAAHRKAEAEARRAETAARKAETEAAEKRMKAEVEARRAEAETRKAEAVAAEKRMKAEAEARMAEAEAAEKRMNAAVEAIEKRVKAEVEAAEKRIKAEAETAAFNLRMDKLDEKLGKIDEKTGGIDENIGSHAEQYFQNVFAENMVFGNIKYDSFIPNLTYNGKNGGLEFDIVLRNGDSIALIEIKSRVHPKFVKEFANERVKKFRTYFPEYAKYKAYLGVAGFSFSKAVLEEAKKYGVGIIRQVGNGVEMEVGRLRVY